MISLAISMTMLTSSSTEKTITIKLCHFESDYAIILAGKKTNKHKKNKLKDDYLSYI